MELIQITTENLYLYKRFDELYDAAWKRYQSRIYPKDYERALAGHALAWYYIYVDTRLIGSVWLELQEEDSAVLGVFIADSAFRGKGYGRQAVQEAVMRGLPGVCLKKVVLTVRADNPRAQKCYQHAGFVQKAAFINDMGIQMLYMEYLY